MKALIIFLLLFALAACSTQKSSTNTMSTSDRIINEAIQAHGGNNYNSAHYAFTFRGKRYTFKNDGSLFRYTLSQNKDGQEISDVLDNDGFTRYIDTTSVHLSEKDQLRFSTALNSVIYFATLPHKLSDKAVNTTLIGETSIANEAYSIIKVSFAEEGGGVDHDDVFYYWINKSNAQVDFLAYSYAINGGGVRFRTARNKRRIGGILFQDYINYKAPIETPLEDLPRLWETDQLKKLSEILTENVEEL